MPFRFLIASSSASADDDLRMTAFTQQIGFSYRCQFCANNAPLYMQVDPATGETYNSILDTNFAGWNATWIEMICQDPTVGTCEALGCMPGQPNVDQPMDYEGRTCGAQCAQETEEYDTRYKFMGFSAVGGWQLHFTRRRIREWCDYCVLPGNDGVNPMTQSGLLRDNVEAMGGFDWLALFFASFVVAFQIVGELKDVRLCLIATQRAGKPSGHLLEFLFSFVFFCLV